MDFIYSYEILIFVEGRSFKYTYYARSCASFEVFSHEIAIFPDKLLTRLVMKWGTCNETYVMDRARRKDGTSMHDDPWRYLKVPMMKCVIGYMLKYIVEHGIADDSNACIPSISLQQISITIDIACQNYEATDNHRMSILGIKTTFSVIIVLFLIIINSIRSLVLDYYM